MTPKIRNDINGWLVVDKPEGIGSTEVVTILKHLTHPMKIGHGGTLDPLASGVLPIAFGKATRTVSYVMDGLKTYEFGIQFGIQTATDDREGEVVATSAVLPSASQIDEVLSQFVGDIEQMPPAYSALKVNGKRAYDLIRKGIVPDLKSRTIHIDSLRLKEMPSADKALLEVVCGKGTYVRSLGRDIALALGTVGHLFYLRRTACAAFSIKDSFSLEKIKEICYNNNLQEQLFSLETVLSDILELAVDEKKARALSFGQTIGAPLGAADGTLYRAMWNGQLVAFVKVAGTQVQPTKVFKQFN